MTLSRTFVLAVSIAAPSLLSSVTYAAPPSPSGGHPRLFLREPTRNALKAMVSTQSSAAARAIDLCKKVASEPASFQKSGYQGDNWAFPLSACALAWQLTGDAAHAAAGVKLWKALLSDIDTIGDNAACVPGATSEKAIAAIKRDTGYAIRFIGPHTALAYDWLHDAPGVDDGLRAQSRACFRAWIDWYTKGGYLNDEPGANYHAGFVAAKTFIAVAEAGEDGAASDKMWTETVDDIFGKQLVGKGLDPKGALSGGDWAEGWQYGPLSVLHYALSARALEEQGVALPAMRQWSTDLTLRFIYGLVPARDGAYVGGDTEVEAAYIEPNGRVLAATMAGSGSDKAAGWAAFLRANLPAAHEPDPAPVFDALAEARGANPVDPASAKLSFWYLAKGTRNVYARSSFERDALWAVFTSGPRVVDDHQHVDASNFVLTRGADHLIVDPSPYGSRSTLTGNALTVDSAISNPEYRPSQTPWSEAELPWVRGTKSGVVAARGDLAKAFIFSSQPSDVPFARRDWVFTPEGEVITIDRVRTDAAGRSAHLRFRTPGKLTLAGKLATAKVGGSQLAIHQVKISGGTAAIKSYPAVGNCESGPFGACRNARIPVDEYALDIPGPRPLAIHAIDALAAGEAPAEVVSMNDAPVNAATENDGVVGAAVYRGKNRTFVVASSANDGIAGATLGYGTPGDASARHVVFDAPEDASGNSTVTAKAAGGRCAITITPGGTLPAHPLGFSVSTAADGCKVEGDPDVAPGSAAADANSPWPSGGGGGVNDTTGGGAGGGCGCMSPRPRTPHASAALLFVAFALSVSRKRSLWKK